MAEVVEGLLYAFRELGCEADVARNEIITDGINLVFFSFYVADINSIPANSILFNAEQIDEDSRLLTPAYLEQLGRFVVWDYSKRNIDRIAARVHGALLQQLSIGYAPNLRRIEISKAQDIDVLFYGALNERRRKILDDLRSHGCVVFHTDNTYGEARDNLIARSKIVLNLHFYEAKIFEIVRVAYLLCNGVAVVSECDDETEMDDELRDAIAGAAYSDLVETCLELLGDSNRRSALARRGYEIFKKRDQVGLLFNVIAESKFTLPLPRQVNFGSGESWKAEYLNINSCYGCNADIVFDLASPEVFTVLFELDRFGKQKLPESYFSKIVAEDVFGHIENIVGLMRNLLRMLTVDGQLYVKVPYDLSYGASQDPRLIRSFNEKSWIFTDGFWSTESAPHGFHIDSLEFDLSDYGNALTAAQVSREDILRTPRAVDSLRVILRKKDLTLGCQSAEHKM